VLPILLVLAALSASSAPAGGPILCSARTLSARGGFQGATGGIEGGITVTNRRPYACTLSGRPGIRFFNGSFDFGVRKLYGPSSSGWKDPRTFVLLPGQRAYVRLRWSNWCGRRFSYVGLLVTIRTGQPRLIVDGTTSTPPCFKRSAASVVAVGPWESR